MKRSLSLWRHNSKAAKLFSMPSTWDPNASHLGLHSGWRHSLEARRLVGLLLEDEKKDTHKQNEGMISTNILSFQ